MSEMRLRTFLGEVGQLDVDALVCGATTDLYMAGGLALQVKQAGGDQIEAQALAHAPRRPGEAVATGAGRLRARHVIHAVVTEPGGRASLADVRRATEASLRLAEQMGCRSVSLPALGSAMAGAPLGEVVKLVVDAALAHRPVHLEEVVFAVCQPEPYHLFKRELRRTRRGDASPPHG